MRFSPLGRMPIKSLEEIRQMFQRLSVRRLSSSPLPSVKESSSESPNSFVSKLAIFRTKLSSPALDGAAQRAAEPHNTDSPENSQVPQELEMVNVAAGCEHNSAVSSVELSSLPKLCYEAESPDEAALVHAARAYKCILQSKTPDRVTVDFAGLGSLTFQLLHILPFDSVRKRMSVVVRHPVSNKVVVYTKGADSVMMDLLRTASEGIYRTSDSLLTFAVLQYSWRDGLINEKRPANKQNYYLWIGIVLYREPRKVVLPVTWLWLCCVLVWKLRGAVIQTI